MFALVLQINVTHVQLSSLCPSPQIESVFHHISTWVMVMGTKTLIFKSVYFVAGRLAKLVIVLINLHWVHLDLSSGIFQCQWVVTAQLLAVQYLCLLFPFLSCRLARPPWRRRPWRARVHRSACSREHFPCFPKCRMPAINCRQIPFPRWASFSFQTAIDADCK